MKTHLAYSRMIYSRQNYLIFPWTLLRWQGKKCDIIFSDETRELNAIEEKKFRLRLIFIYH